MSRRERATLPQGSPWRALNRGPRARTPLDKGATLDLLRHLRATKSLAGERDLFEFADLFNNAGLPGDAKSVPQGAAAMHQVRSGQTGLRLPNAGSERPGSSQRVPRPDWPQSDACG